MIKHFQSLPEVNKDQFFVYGGSRGAVIAGMIATTETKLAGVILKSGVYDFQEWSELKPWYNYIKLQMLWETGWPSENKMKERSAYYFAHKIKTPLLIIHGTKDDRAPIGLVEKFANKVNAEGGTARLLKLESEHVIPMPEINGEMEKFMRSLISN